MNSYYPMDLEYSHQCHWFDSAEFNQINRLTQKRGLELASLPDHIKQNDKKKKNVDMMSTAQAYEYMSQLTIDN